MSRFAPIKRKNKKNGDIVSDYKYGFSMPENYIFKSKKGLNQQVVSMISAMKKEPEWMMQKRLKGYEVFLEKKMPEWGADLSEIDFNDIFYYIKPNQKVEKSWDDVPKEVKDTYDKLGIPEAEKEYLGGVKAQYESEVVYGSLRSDLAKMGIIFCGMDEALIKYPEMVKEYFGKIIPPGDNKFAALNTAVWSGGSFIYIPKGVKCDKPLQAYFRINSANMGQFERTLIIVDEGAFVNYVEGCFLAGAKVKTSLGIKMIEDVKVGDKVWTNKARFKKVNNVLNRKYRGKVYSIKYYGDSGMCLNVTEEHPLLVVKRKSVRDRNKQFKKEWLSAGEVKIKDYLVMPFLKIVPKKNPYYVKEVKVGSGSGWTKQLVEINKDEDLFRLFGYYLAEGHVDNEHSLTFSFNSDEVDYLADVEKIVTRIMGKKVIKNKIRNNGQTLVVCSTKWARFIAKEFGDNVKNKKIPDWIWHCDLEVLREMIKGMWRGDGSYDKRKNLFRYSTVNRNLAEGFRDILLNLRIGAGINLQERKEPRKNLFQVVVYSPYNKLFGEMVGKVAVNGKLSGSPVVLGDGNVFYPIKSILIEDKSETVYNLSVEDDESYLAEGVISHNCTAPIYSTDSLHAAVVEIFVKKGGRCRYTTIQNWSTNVYNLVTKRAWVDEEGVMEWVDGNLGSKVTMKYPSVFLAGRKAHGEILSIAVAGKGQHQDAGGKCIHLAAETTSRIISKSISFRGGRSSYRGMITMNKGAKNAKSKVVCDALILDKDSRSDTYPVNKIYESEVSLEHEATVSKIGEEQLFYLMSRGFEEHEAEAMIVNGFIEPIVKELPMEYSVELNRLINLQMEGSVG